MTQLSTLYKIDSKGKIREWSIEIDGPAYRTIYGEKGGQLITTEWTRCTSKNVNKSNATTTEEQAVLEATALHKKQTEKGYGITATKPLGSVMLAEKYDDYIGKIKFPLYSNPKLDGLRCVINKNGMFSRNKKVFVSCPHILEELRPIIDNLPQGISLDGELYNHELHDDFNKICSLVKRAKCSQVELAESKKLVQFWCYDITNDKEIYSKRYDWIKNNLSGLKFTKVLSSELVKNQTELNSLYEKYLEDGYEGQMIRIDKPYQDKRTKFLLKRKEFITEEFTILNIVEGVGNRSGMAGNMEFVTKEGKPFKSNIKADWSQLQEYLDNKVNYIGKEATIRFFAYTPDKIPRFPYVISIRDYE